MPSFLSGRTVMVTGATSGIGYETARLLAECGATALLHGRTPQDARAAVSRTTPTGPDSKPTAAGKADRR